MIIDAHLDLAYNVGRGRDVRMPAKDQPEADGEIATVGFPDLRAGDVGLVFATIFCQPDMPKHAGYTSPDEAHAQAVVQLDRYDAWEREGLLRIERTSTVELRSSKGENTFSSTIHDPLSTFILLEGAEAIRTPADAQAFYDRGVRIVGLSWQRTRYAGGTATPGPLTASGRELVTELDRLGILHDASHLAERSFWDLFHFTSAPIIASHSNCRSIVRDDPNERHLTNAMVRAIAERDGVIGINFYDRFLLPADQFGKRRATFADVVAHARHICDLTGSADHVAIGTDLDGGLGREQVPIEIETIANLGQLADALGNHGFTPANVAKVMGGNWLRVIRRARWRG